ncbi:transcriptional regulator LacI family [Bifidobacterium sp. DSM 109957]|uniref:Transcriptional regulator LacI family n=2 Tax=Bifidobacterium oedipodis TaxID=2675322 RepID=A0A7Y0ERK9_9BIFI|nr:transcriptional regulator LacI family [Bifidobacterium sp. DSM 109957]
MKSTIHDVAEKAGVSVATVSRTFSRPDVVSQTTRDKVLQAAKDLDFNISRSAAALKSQQSFRVAMLTSEAHANWFNANISIALNDVLQPAGYDICTYRIANAAERQAFFADLPLRRNVDAVIVNSFSIDGDEISNLKKMNIPVVGINVPSSAGFDATISIDEYESMRLLVRHLHDLGHRDISFVCSNSAQAPLRYSADLRMDAFLRACHDFDDTTPTVIRVPRDKENEDELILSRFLTQSPRPTAICCQSDATAIPLIFKLPRCGVSVPRDVSVLGFDDSTYARQVELTTIHQSPEELGYEAARRTLQLIQGTCPEPRHLTMETYLALRGTTAPPRSSNGQRND